MEENTKTELHLSEEQLQAITGGCGDCVKDEKKIADFDREARGHLGLHQIALETGFPDQAAMHLLQGNYASTMSQLLRDDIMERHKTPVDNTAPGGLSGNGLAKK